MQKLFSLITIKLILNESTSAYFYCRYDAVEGKDVCTRQQIPLRLAFGTTIHKVQGLTLDYVEIDCRDMFAAGQLGVALGRAKNTKTVRIKNFDPERHIIKANFSVLNLLSDYPTLTHCQCDKPEAIAAMAILTHVVPDSAPDDLAEVSDEDVLEILMQ